MTNTPRARLLGAAAIAAPVLLLASTLAYIAGGDGMNDGEAGGAIQVWAMIAYAVVVVGLARLLATESPGLADVLLVAGLAGTAGGVGYGIDSIQAALVSGESLQEMESAAASLALQVPGILFPLGLAALGFALLRADLVNRFTGAGLVVGALLFPASRIPDVEALAVVADVVLLAALVPFGWSLVRAAGDRRAVRAAVA